MQRFLSCLRQGTVYEFDKAWNSLLEDYSNQEDLVEYLRKEWWPFRMEIADCYVDLHLHFGTR